MEHLEVKYDNCGFIIIKAWPSVNRGINFNLIEQPTLAGVL